jgi:superfamily II DNA or RNA helicase
MTPDGEDIVVELFDCSVVKHPIPLLRAYGQNTHLSLKTVVGSQYTVAKSAADHMIKRVLTLRPRAFNGASGAPYTLYDESDDVIRVPRIFGLMQFGPAGVDDRTLVREGIDAVPFTTNISLRGFQEKVVNHALTCIRTPPLHAALINADCGLGKTVMAIQLIASLGLRTCILVHKEFLAEQWESRIAEFCPGLDTGRVQSTTFSPGTVTIAMIQTVCNGKYAPDAFDEFEVIVVDEMHHLAAQTFQKAMRYFKARYVIGLSATLKRGDGNEHALPWFFGHPIASCKRAFSRGCRGGDADEVPAADGTRPLGASRALDGAITVEMVRAESNIRPFDARTTCGKLRFSAMLTSLIATPGRAELIVGKVRDAFLEGRHVLVISERVDLLDTIKEMLMARHGIAAAKFVGEVSKKKKRDRDDAAKTASVLLTTRAMASEGFDRPMISTVILATPQKQGTSLEQSIGRCQRQCTEKTHPNKVIDIVDPFSVFAGMARGRERFYRSRGYTIVNERACTTVNDLARTL